MVLLLDENYILSLCVHLNKEGYEQQITSTLGLRNILFVLYYPDEITPQ